MPLVASGGAGTLDDLDSATLLRDADQLATAGEPYGAIATLTRTNRTTPSAEVEAGLAQWAAKGATA